MKTSRLILIFSTLLSHVAIGCGDNRESFESYAKSADHIVLGGVVSMRQDDYGDFISKSAENYDLTKGLPIDISRYPVEFEINVLYKYKGSGQTPIKYYLEPCYGNVDLGGLYVIFSSKTEFGFEAVTYNAYSWPEIIKYLNRSINKKLVVDLKESEHN